MPFAFTLMRKYVIYVSCRKKKKKKKTFSVQNSLDCHCFGILGGCYSRLFVQISNLKSKQQ